MPHWGPQFTAAVTAGWRSALRGRGPHLVDRGGHENNAAWGWPLRGVQRLPPLPLRGKHVIGQEPVRPSDGQSHVAIGTPFGSGCK